MGQQQEGVGRGPAPGTATDLRVLIVEQATILREGVRRVVEGAPGLQVVAAVAELDRAMTALRDLRPQVVLVDARLPNQMAFFLTRAARREAPSARVVVLSDEGGEAVVEQAAEAGAAAVVLEKIDPDEFRAVLRTVGGDGIDFLGYVDQRAG